MVTPCVLDGAFVSDETAERQPIAIGSPEWYAWLSGAKRFFFRCSTGTFTAYRESGNRGASFWRACRWMGGRLVRVYLGKDEHLDLRRLRTAAAAFRSSASPNGTRTSVSAAAFGGQTLVESTRTTACGSASRLSRPHSILLAKLAPPLVRAALVGRCRLSERLSQSVQYRLTVVVAPAGAGKTTLLAQWIAQSDRAVAWLSLDHGDNDPARFWRHFIAGLQVEYPQIRFADPIPGSGHIPDIQAISNVLADRSGETGDKFLVLDDYHVVENQSIHSDMGFLLENLPANLHLIIGSRSEPVLPLARLRARGQLLEFSAADLNLSQEEAWVFLNEVMGLRLPAEGLAEVHKVTEGWITGLQLVAASAQAGADLGRVVAESGEHRHITDYLAAEVLDRQPEDVREFLLQTSILERFSASLCEAVCNLEKSEGRDMLERLERGNLFLVPLDGARRWYRYHTLFATFLRGRLRASRPEAVTALHQRALGWHVSNGTTCEAVGHALKTSDFETAADLIERMGIDMLTAGETRAVLAWFKVLPEHVVKNRLPLCLFHAHALLSVGEFDEAEGPLQDAEQLIGRRQGVLPACLPARPARSDASARDAGSGFLADRRDALLLAALHQAIQLSRKDARYRGGSALQFLALRYWRGNNVRTGNEILEELTKSRGHPKSVAGAVIGLCLAADVQAAQGRLREVEDIYRKTIRLAEEQGGERIMASSGAYFGMALLQYEWNNLDLATRHLVAGTDLVNRGDIVLLQVMGDTITARLKQARGDISGALGALEHAELLTRGSGLGQTIRRITEYRARLWLRQGNVESAVRWSRTAGLVAGGEVDPAREGDYLTFARVLVAEGRLAEALRVLDRLLAHATALGHVGSVIRILVVRAQASQALLASDEAMETLARALYLAEPEGFVRTFVDAGLPMKGLLRKIADVRRRGKLLATHAPSPAYLAHLLAAFGPNRSSLGASPNRGADETESVFLTGREVEVLRLIGAGWSRPAISRALVLSANTVGSHIKSIYGKLEAHNRVDALAKARALHLQ